MEQTSTLNLSPPPRRKPDHTSFDLGGRAVERWLAELPAAHLGEISKALLQSLREANRLQVRPRARLRFLETVRPRIEETIGALRRDYLPKEFPLPERNARVAELARALLRELAIGYYILVDESSAATGRGSRQLALTVQRCMHVLGKLLLEYCCVYAPAPSGFWLQLHALYLLAENRGVAQRPVPNCRPRYRARCTVADTYKRVLLFAATSPYRMRHDEAAEIYDALEWCAPYSQLMPAGADGPRGGLVIDLQTDQPSAAQQPASADAQTLRLLDVSALADAAATQRPWWRALQRPAPRPEPVLLQRLVIALGVLPSRQSARLTVSAAVQALVGLPQIHRHFMSQQGLAEANAAVDAPQFTARDVRSPGHTRNDVWDLIYPADLLQRLTRTTEQEKPAPSAPPPPREQNWRLLNISAGGYCLLSDRARTARAQIGDPIALEAGETQPRWQLGVVRWLRQTADGLHIGVQVLGRDPAVVLTRIRQPDGGWGPQKRALLLPEDPVTAQPATLLVDAMLYEPQRRAMLVGPQGQQEVVLTRQIEAFSSFAQFEFRVTARHEERAAENRLFST